MLCFLEVAIGQCKCLWTKYQILCYCPDGYHSLLYPLKRFIREDRKSNKCRSVNSICEYQHFWRCHIFWCGLWEHISFHHAWLILKIIKFVIILYAFGLDAFVYVGPALFELKKFNYIFHKYNCSYLFFIQLWNRQDGFLYRVFIKWPWCTR